MNLTKKQLVVIAIAVVVIIAALLIYLATTQSNQALLKLDGTQIPSSMYPMFQISNTELQYIGIGSAGNYPVKITGAPNLTINGKPAIVYQGAEFCPYCASERWAIIIALSRFGNFSGLEYMSSDPSDVWPNTPTFSFVNATYSSQYVTFVTLEFENQTGAPLQSATPLESQLTNKYDPQQNIPFIVFANQSYIQGATYSPEILQNTNWQQVFAQINNPNSTIAQGILGSANLITGQICAIDGNKPANVCSAPYIQQIEKFS